MRYTSSEKRICALALHVVALQVRAESGHAVAAQKGGGEGEGGQRGARAVRHVLVVI